jgi:hypothetical protein
MKRRIGNIVVPLLVATVALASLGVGYGLWTGALQLEGTVNTGSIDLAFVDGSVTSGTTTLPSPFTDDDNTRDDASLVRDPEDTGYCPFSIQGLFDDDEDGSFDEDPINGADDDGDGFIDEDPPGKLTSCDPRALIEWSVVGIDDDGDGSIDEDPVDAVDNDNDGLANEDPPGDFNGDGCPGICGFDDDGDGFTDEGAVSDDDEDGSVDEDDQEPPIDNDNDGLFDEDPVGQWIATPATFGPDRGTAVIASVDVQSELTVQIFRPYVAPPVLGGDPRPFGYAPSVYYHLDNLGTVPVVLVAIDLMLPHEVWERNNDGVLIDLGRNRECDTGDECAPALMATVTGIAVGTEIDPNDPVEGDLHVVVTPASNPGESYALDVGITAHNYNEP